MKIAVLLLCHKNPNQINLFINQMQHESIDIFIHVDKKSNIIDKIENRNNVFILPDEKRIDVGWASISQVKATHNLILFARKKYDYDYYWLCSGQDFPLKSCATIVKTLSQNDGNYINLFESRHNGASHSNNYDKRNDVYYSDVLMGREKWKSIVRRFYVAVTGGYNFTLPIFRRQYKNFKFYFGSQWWCINKHTMNWIIEYEKKNKDYFHYFSHCSTPDESYYHTLVMNSPYALNRKDYLHHIIWPKGEPSPKTLEVSDKDLLLSSEKLMARKFDINIDSKVVELIIDSIKER